MSIFDNDDLDYISAQFSTMATAVDYDAQEQQDPWGPLLTPDSLLRNVDLPSIYNDYYAMLSNDTHSPGISVSAIKHLLDSASQDPIVSEEILSLVSPGCLSHQRNLSRAQYDLSVALLACTQHGLDLSLESVYWNQSDLPVPKLPDISLFSTTTATTESPSSATVSVHTVGQDTELSPSISSGTLSRRSVISPTLSISTSKQQQCRHPEINYDDGDDDDRSRIASAGDNHTIDDRGCNQPRIIDKTKSDPVKGYQWYLDMDLITVSLIPQKEGKLFKYVNYLVTSQHGAISVTRRFNEFYRLWESLLKRYPLRSVPGLPPKKIKVNEVILEKRRRGLARFMNALERHPLLAKDELVHAFLSYQDLQQWWKEHQPSMDDEFIRTMPDIDSLQSNIPHDLTDRLKRIQRRITPAIETYDKMITAVQRLISNEQGEADSLIRYSITLSAMDEEEQQTEHQSTCTPCQHSFQGYEKVAQSMQAIARLLDDKALSLTNTFTEHLHYHRHLFASFEDMLDRKDQLLEAITDNQLTIPRSVAAQIISANRRSPSSPQLSPTLIYQHRRQLSNEQVDIILQRDHIRESLHQHRMLYVHSCLASELTYLHRQQAFISLMYQDLVRQQHKYASEQHQRWKSLQVELDALVSHGPDAFD